MLNCEAPVLLPLPLRRSDEALDFTMNLALVAVPGAMAFLLIPMNPTIQRVRKQRLNLVLDEPFFGSLLLNLRLTEDTSVPTFSVNAVTLRFNPQFAESLTDAQMRGVLIHEVCHCALLHPFRRAGRDLRKFNRAADYAINNFLQNYLQETGRQGRPASYELSDGVLTDHAFDRFSAEQIYDLLPDPSEGGNDGEDGQNQSGAESLASAGQFEDAPSSHAAHAESEAQWKVALTQAVAVARGQGQLARCLARLVNETLRPALPWQDVLRNFFRDLASDDYFWSRPNKRFLPYDIYLPSLRSPSLGEIVVALDTSGSITPKLLGEFLSEVQALLDVGRPRKLYLLDCDASVHSAQEFVPGDRIDMQPQGGGGTDFRPVFDHVAEQNIDPTSLVYLTDLEGAFPDTPPLYPVLWVSYGTDTAAFGEVLKIR
jgi:predicted metal-dependent peptidase